jgi:hypothetical protein
MIGVTNTRVFFAGKEAQNANGRLQGQESSEGGWEGERVSCCDGSALALLISGY